MARRVCCSLGKKKLFRFYAKKGWRFKTQINILWCLYLNRGLPFEVIKLISRTWVNISEEDSGDNADNTIEGIFSDTTILYFKMHSQINKEPACFSIIHSMWNYGMCLTCCFQWGLIFLVWQKRQSVDLNEHIGWQDGVIVPVFYDLLDLLLSEDSCK